MSDYVPLLRALPHRYPILLIDRVVELLAGERCVARKVISRNEPCYAAVTADDDEQALAYPSMLLLESWVQTAALVLTTADGAPGAVLLLGALSDAEFSGAVLPGDVVEHHARVVRAVADTVIVEGHSYVDGEVRLTVRQAVLARRDPAELDL